MSIVYKGNLPLKSGVLNHEQFFSIIDTVLRTSVQTITLPVGATTFEVVDDTVIVIGDAGGNTIATITGGVIGQKLSLLFSDALVTITDNNTHTSDSIDLGSAFTSADDKTLMLLFDGTSWYETGRSVN